MSAIHIHLDTPFLTKKEFMSRTGIKPSTLDQKMKAGEIPYIKTALTLVSDGDDRSLVLINMVKLYEMAVSDSFEHPRFHSSNTKLNRG